MSDSQNQDFLTKMRKFWHPINIYNNLKKLYFALIPKGSKVYNVTYGFLRIFLKQLHLFNIYYREWIRRFDTLTEEKVRAIRSEIDRMEQPPTFSVVMPVYNPPPDLLEQAIQSVLDQVYPHWELCIADDASTDPRIKILLQEYSQKDTRIKTVFRTENGHISAASNSAIDLVENDYIVLLDHDDLLHPLALYHVAKVIQGNPDCVVIYSDEDKITGNGRRLDPYFKPDFDPELILSQNMVSHLGVYKTSAVRKVGGFRLGLEGSQDYDLLLRVNETCSPDQIHHIPLPLYHWRIFRESAARDVNVKPYAINAGVRAISEHLQRRNIAAEVKFLPELAGYAVDYILPTPAPSVTLLLRSTNPTNVLASSLESILMRTDYPHYQVLLCVPQGADQLPENLLQAWQVQVSIREQDPATFSCYAKSINQCLDFITTDFVCLVDEAVTGFVPKWLSALLGQAVQPGIGAVAPRLINQKDRVYSNGIVLLPGKPPQHLSKGEEEGVNGYFGWAKLTRGYSALSEKCILFKTDHLTSLGGLAINYSDSLYTIVDFCLKMKTEGLRHILFPSVSLYINEDHHYNDSNGSSSDEEEDFERFAHRWQSWLQNDPSFNPNLTLIDEGKILVNLSPHQELN